VLNDLTEDSSMTGRNLHWLLAGVIALLGVPTTCVVADDASATNVALGRGINLGNMLEAPREGEWGARVEDAYFQIIREAGFDSVRIPVRWSAHAEADAPYTIEESFFRRVDHVIEQALENGLHVIVNVHHYEEIHQQPKSHQARLLGLWRQIAERYRDLPHQVCFEILNEPHGELSAEVWNDLLIAALAVIRESNPQRLVVVGPVSWNHPARLDELQLPEEDRRIIVTFHFYEPFEFTHQGAHWVRPNPPPTGRVWEGTEAERRQIEDILDRVARWSRTRERPVFLGEFGAYSGADLQSRIRWTRFVREQAEQRGFSWAYWEFSSGFGAYDPKAKLWRVGLRQALVSP
jgi:endoglucanase